MGWKQLRDANWQIPYVGGWCEGFVEGAYGQATYPKKNSDGEWYTDGVYPTAINAWENQPIKHTDYPPAGITVPVYFSLGYVWQGHVAIRLDDLMVASTTQDGNPDDGKHNKGYIHHDIYDMINLYAQYNGGCTYLGWGEYVGRIRVVEWEAPYTPPTVIPEPPVTPPVAVVEPPVIVPEPKPEEPPVVVEEPIVEPDLPAVDKKIRKSWLVVVVDAIIKLIKIILGR